MEIAEHEEQEVISVLRQHPIGISMDGIWAKAKMFSEKHDLSRLLHRMSQQGTIYKVGQLYKLTLVDYEGSEVAKPEITRVSDAVTQAATHKPVKPVEPSVAKPAAALYGDLSRSKSLGVVAMVMWKYGEEEYYLSTSKIKSASGIEVVYHALGVLVERGYVLKAGSGRDACYKWSGKFKYPFSNIKASDDLMVKVPPKSATVQASAGAATTERNVPPTADAVQQVHALEPVGVESGAVVKPVQHISSELKTNSHTLSVLDAKISATESHLDSLKELRSLLAKELGIA